VINANIFTRKTQGERMKKSKVKTNTDIIQYGISEYVILEEIRKRKNLEEWQNKKQEEL